MKKFIALLLVCFVFIPAQSKDKKDKKKFSSRIGVSYGYVTREQALSGIWGDRKRYQNSDFYNYDLPADKATRLFGYDPYIRNEHFTRSGAFSVNYHANIIKHIRLGISLTYEQQTGQLTMPNTNPHIDARLPIGAYNRNSWTVAPECQINFWQSKYIGLYSLLGFGNTYVSETYTGTISQESEYDNYFAFQLTPFGIKVGGKLNGFLEAGFGYKGVLNLGLNYRLN